MDWIISGLANLRGTFFATYFLHPAYTLAALAIVYLVWRRRGAAGESFWRFAFPKELYLHPSTMVDIKIIAFNLLVFGSGLISAFFFTPFVAIWTFDALSGVIARPELPTTPWRGAIALVILFLVQDFVRYWNHYLHHGTKVLWPFHAVHHSAEVMTPITFLRAHPMYTILQAVMMSLLLGAAQALVVFALVGHLEAWVFWAGAWAFNAYVFFGGHLRHSHVWLSYGRVLEHVLISPAQHQIHHSSDPRHHDKNFGEIFAIWDWMFGTLYVPDGPEKLIFGIAGADGVRIEQPHTGLRAAMLGPFREAWEEILEGSSRDPNPETRRDLG